MKTRTAEKALTNMSIVQLSKMTRHESYQPDQFGRNNLKRLVIPTLMKRHGVRRFRPSFAVVKATFVIAFTDRSCASYLRLLVMAR